MRQTTSLRAAVLGFSITLAACGESSYTTSAPNSGGGVSSVDSSTGSYNRTRRNDVQIVSATGDITAAVKEYRDLLGALSPNVKDEQAGERREINWDGVPIGNTNNDTFNGNFFNSNSPRGLVTTTSNGSVFSVSQTGYTEVNNAYDGEFNTFSQFKLFVARGTTVIDVLFFVAGSTTPAVVTGFGSVFADVGRANSTTIEYFDVNGKRLLKVAAPRASDAKGLSFVGAKFDARIVARVRITSGDTPIGADVTDNVKGAGQKRDIVAMDDFIYGEPRKIQQ